MSLIGQMPCKHFLRSVPGLLGNKSHLQDLFSKYIYVTFTIKPLENSHVGISKLQENCFVNNLSSVSLLTTSGQAGGFSKPFFAHKTAFLRIFSALRASMEGAFAATERPVEFSKIEESPQLKEWYSKKGLYRMLE